MIWAAQRKVLVLEPGNAALGQTDRVQRAGQLEANLSKLFGMLSLLGCASGVIEDLTVRLRRE